METTEEDEMRTWAEEYAKKNGWVLNPDKKILDTVIRGLVRNKKKFGEQYCPCRLGPGTRRRTGRSSAHASTIKTRSHRTSTATASSTIGRMTPSR